MVLGIIRAGFLGRVYFAVCYKGYGYFLGCSFCRVSLQGRRYFSDYIFRSVFFIDIFRLSIDLIVLQ